MRFEARWDWRLRAFTGVMVVVFSAMAIGVLAAGLRTGDPGAVVVAAIAASAIVAILLIPRALAPIGYAVEGNAVKVLRRVGPIEIPLSRVRAAGPIGSVRWAVRLGGSGGLFGFFGLHWSRHLGAFRLQATRLDGLVQLDTPEERFVLSPDPAGRFLDEVLARAPGAARVPAEGPHARHRVPRRFWLGPALAIVGAALIAGTAAVASLLR